MGPSPLEIEVLQTTDRECCLILRSPAKFLHQLQTAVILLQHVGEEVRKYNEALRRDAHTHVLKSAIRQQQMMVQKIYQEYRHQGLRHRAAIRATMFDARCKDLKWTPADFSWCSKVSFDSSPLL